MNNSSVSSNINDAGLPLEFTQPLETSFEKAVNDYHANSVPEFEKAKSAIFTSDWNGDDYPFAECDLQSKIATDFSRLTGLGYDTMVVNTGTQYGMLALKELAAIRKVTPFRLIMAKIRGVIKEEPNIYTAMWMSRCECFYYADDAEQYRDKILSQMSFVSDEVDLKKE